jgi:hypothetical protein
VNNITGAFIEEDLMADRHHSEKPEKQDEKQDEKHGKDEKSTDEKWRRDPLGAVIWALILIWAGVVFLVQNLGLLPVERFGLIGTWGAILVGAGVLLLLEVLVRVLIPEYRRPVVGTLILAFVLIGVGLGQLANWGVLWGVALVIIGAAVLVGGLMRRR